MLREQDRPVPAAGSADPAAGSTSDRILAATAEVLGRNGMSKLSLSEVALQAGVSRPTLYRWFASKEELLDAFGAWERRKFDNGVNQATAGGIDQNRTFFHFRNHVAGNEVSVFRVQRNMRNGSYMPISSPMNGISIRKLNT